MSHVKNIAIIGGSGNVGSPILKALLATSKFAVTAITRSDSSSTFSADVKIQRGDYNSEEFFVSALQNQDVLIIILAAQAPKDLQGRIIEAAGKARVEYIFPCEFGPDTGSKEMAEGVFFLGAKKVQRDQIEGLKNSSWIGYICGLWYDWSLYKGFLGFNIKERTARLFNDGNTKLSTSTLAHVGVGVAKFLELPRSMLETYKNKFFYAQSFCISQNEILESLYKATGTTRHDWKITSVDVDEAIAKGKKETANGNFRGMLDVLYGMNLKQGCGGDFNDKIGNKVIGLDEEDLDSVAKKVVDDVLADEKP